MVDIATALASSVIFLFAPNGTTPLGTGFIVGYPVPGGAPGQYVPLVVTAKHVIGGHRKVVGRFSTKEGNEPAKVPYDLDQLRKSHDFWTHDDEGVDIAVFRTMHFDVADYQPFPLDLVADKETFELEDIKVADRVIFPSLLVNFMGTTRNYPITRDGSIASIPGEAVPLEYDVGHQRIKTSQEVVLLDATSVPGASGSPIFLWPGPRLKGGAFAVGGGKPWLIGVMHGFYPASAQPLVGIQVNKVVPGFAENSGIALVFPAWRLKEILEREDLAQRIAELTGQPKK